jgi:hypothetical protein
LEAGLQFDYRAALEGMRSLLDRGGVAVMGELIWQAEPTEAAVAPLGGRLDEFVLLPELLDHVGRCGFGVARVHQATQDEWDRFESGFTAGYVRWLADNPPDHPNAAAVSERLRAMQDRYHRGYRGILGQAYLQLVAL